MSDPDTEQDDREVRFAPRGQSGEQISATPVRIQATTDCEILNTVKTLNGAIAAVSQDTAKIQRAYDQLRTENIARVKALTDLSEIVKEYGLSPARMRPQPGLQVDVMDEEGNLRAADIGITWENNKTLLYGVRVVGLGPPRQTGIGPAMSTPYQPIGGRDRDSTPSTVRPPTSETIEVTPDVDTHIRRPPPEIDQGYRPAAPGWSKDQRALQLVSYLDETTMNVAQELGDADLYNYDVLVKLLSDRFDPASRVSAFRSRFHGRSRRHHEDADAFADVHQIRTQKDRKLQTLIEVCTDFSSLSTPTHLHKPAEQTFAIHQQMETPYMEDDCDSEAVFAVGDRLPWTNRRPPEASGVPTLQQMFALARWMGYEMQPISRQTDAPRQQPGGRSPVDQNRGFRSQPRTGCDYSKFKCFSCGQFGHMQSRCPNPDASLPFKPAGWFLQSEGNQTERRRKSDGKLPLDRDLTHTGLRVHHSTPIHPSDTKSSWDSPSPDTTITCIHQQQPVQPGIDASLANQDQDQDHQETQKVSPQDFAEGMTVSHCEARMTEFRKEGTRPDTRSTGRSVDWSDTIEDQPTEEAILQISGVGHWFLEG